MRGFAYYVVDDGGRPALARNPRYKKVSEIVIIEASTYPLRQPEDRVRTRMKL